MAGVFLSYDREDAYKARPLAQTLERAGHQVWWDLHVRGGAQFSKVIEEALKAADAVVVLWSAHSVESAWVRDEAAAGRDTGRLVPVTLDGVTPPLGFRQFQTIDLSRRDRRKTQLQELLAAVASYSQEAAGSPVPLGAPGPAPVQTHRRLPRSWVVVAGALIALLLVGIGWWRWSTARELPLVEVAAADASPNSQAAASDLFVKLGSLAQVGNGKWRLVDASHAPSHPDFIFRTADTGSPAQPRANLVLLGKDGGLLWSREFNFTAGQQADLLQLESLTTGRVLGCALESRAQGGLSADLLKIFLDACASLADLSGEEYGPVTAQLRRVIDRAPRFEPAWSRLIMAESTALTYARYTGASAPLRRQLATDAARARKLFPDLPELAIAELRLRDRVDYGRDIHTLSAAVERSPDNPELLGQLSDAYLNVGRMDDAISNARRAAELDPLSPGGSTTYIMTLAHGGQPEVARKELAKAEKLWTGTGSLRDAQIAFFVRYGDPATAMKLDPVGYNTAFYYSARADPSPTNIARLKAGIDEFRPKVVTPAQVGWAVQALAEFGLVDDAYYWFGRLPSEDLADISYILFRPALASVRRDPRFMPLAKRIGLVDYWRNSGQWPDFCGRPGIPYDCKAEAAKLQ